MFSQFKKNKKGNGNKEKVSEIFPDEILLDAHNLPDFDRHRFEGRLERPIGKRALFSVFLLFVIVAMLLVENYGSSKFRKAQPMPSKAKIIAYDRNLFLLNGESSLIGMG